jgi:hypothetical protein
MEYFYAYPIILFYSIRSLLIIQYSLLFQDFIVYDISPLVNMIKYIKISCQLKSFENRMVTYIPTHKLHNRPISIQGQHLKEVHRQLGFNLSIGHICLLNLMNIRWKWQKDRQMKLYMTLPTRHKNAIQFFQCGHLDYSQYKEFKISILYLKVCFKANKNKQNLRCADKHSCKVSWF